MTTQLPVGPWHPADSRPVHQGWYECRVTIGEAESEIHRSYWDGTHWRLDDVGGGTYAYQNRAWRGCLK